MQGAKRTGGETADEGRLAGLGPDLGEELSSGCQVGGPAEPASMASIHVLVHADLRQLLEGVGDASLEDK